MKKSFIMKWTYKHDIFHGLSSLNSNFLTNCECSQIYFIYSYIGILGTNVFLQVYLGESTLQRLKNVVTNTIF